MGDENENTKSESRRRRGREEICVWGKGNLYFFSFSISISLSFSPSSRRNGKAEAFFSSLRLDFSEHSSRAPLCSLMRLLLFFIFVSYSHPFFYIDSISFCVFSFY